MRETGETVKFRNYEMKTKWSFLIYADLKLFQC